MLLRFLRLLRGYVVFSAVGGFGERFINLCALRKINIWDISCAEKSITGKIFPGDLKKLGDVGSKTGAEIEIQSERGLPFYLKAHNNRIGMVIGAVFFVVFSLIMNRFVWCINVSDGSSISREQLIKAAEGAGLRYGVYVPSFDEEKAAREIYRYFDGELSYVKINIKGSLAVIEYRESKENLKIESEGQPSNIVADFDGIIISDETYRGMKNISRGNAVRKGDVLISGVVEGIDSKPLYYEAEGCFTALHSCQSKYVMGYSQKISRLVKAYEFNKIIIFGLKIPLGFFSYPAGNVRIYSDTKLLEYGGYVLPFGIERNTAAVYERAEANKEILCKIACMNYSTFVYDEYKNSNIVSENVNITNETDRLIISGEYECIDFIGESKPIIIENIEN